MRLAVILALVGCGSTASPGVADAPSATPDAADAPCTTRITYGRAWIRPATHPAQDDVVAGDVTWDGACVADGANAYAVLSNGFRPYFEGHGTCAIAIDPSPACGATPCTTRVTYGAAWRAPAGHPATFDDVAGRVYTDGACPDDGTDSFARLSNDWLPHFAGHGTCDLAFAWRGCGGTYANPVIDRDCPDPGVVRDGDRYVLSCTSGNAGDAFPILTSRDLVHWTDAGHILPASARPAWAVSDFWAPEIHPVGARWVAYFSARGQDGRLAIGAATADAATGPFTALAQPIVHDAGVGLIDVTELSAGGRHYLAWKEDGNAQGAATPIHVQEIAADGTTLVGARATAITNDRAWEGALVEAPFLVEHAGMYYLFYSGNAYYDGRYAVGVARAASPLGPYEKRADPIVVTNARWVGPGHGSVVDGPGGESYLVYHAWKAGHVNGPGDGRVTLVDRIEWRDGWPVVPLGPSFVDRPSP